MDIDMRDLPSRPRQVINLIEMARKSEEEMYKERANIPKKDNAQDLQKVSS